MSFARTVWTACLVLLLAACSPSAPGPAASGSAAPSTAATTPVAGTRGESPAPPEPEKETPAPEETAAPPPGPEPTAAEPVPGPAKGHDNPARLDVVVNKARPLKPLDYAPADLRLPAVPLGPGGDAAVVRDAVAGAVERMFAAAAADGVPMTLLSGFRSYQTQMSTYRHWVAVNGQAGADRVSARPGYSEHQTGLAVDVGDPDGSCNLSACFGDTAAGRWVARNAHRFGFIVRYQPGQESVTGYAAEPWHLRYVGRDVAADMTGRGVKALETYFGLPPAPDYR